MAKKIYDVLPPKVVDKFHDTVDQFAFDYKKKSKRGGKKSTQKTGLPLGRMFVGGFIVLLLVGIYFYNTLPKAIIEISPRTDTLNLEEKVTADKSIKEVSLINKTIPAQLVETEKDGRQDFPATGVS